MNPIRCIAIAVAILISALVLCSGMVEGGGSKFLEDSGRLELVKLIVLNRHGHRAPNPPYWSMCPNDLGNKAKYNVNMEDLTGLGMQEEFDFGVWLRHRYHDFIGIRFNRTQHFIRAVGEPRILQSAMAVAQGMFPDGFGPAGFLPARPQFVPIFSDMDTHEYLLDDVPCFRRATADSQRWVDSQMDTFAADPSISEPIKKLQELCGPIMGPQPTVSTYIKTVVDGVIFNSDYGLTVLGGQVNSKMMYQLRNISIQMLLNRLYSTDAQQTYTSMDYPETLLGAFDKAKYSISQMDVDDFEHPFQKVEVFVCHREALYAFAKFFGFDFDIATLPRMEVPVSTALIFELLRDKATDTYYVRTNVYTPFNGKYTIAYPGCKSPRLCKLTELHGIFDKRVNRTGAWRQLCNYTEPELDRITGIR